MSKIYHPEDLEVLLREKTYDQLVPEEVEFVLRHIQSKEEYTQMRQLIFQIEEQEWDAAPPVAPSVKADLMSEFKSKNKKGFTIWLNSLFARNKSHNWGFAPAVRWSVAVAVLGVLVYVFIPSQLDQETLADNFKEEEIKDNSQVETATDELARKRKTESASQVKEIEKDEIQIDNNGNIEAELSEEILEYEEDISTAKSEETLNNNSTGLMNTDIAQVDGEIIIPEEPTTISVSDFESEEFLEIAEDDLADMEIPAAQEDDEIGYYDYDVEEGVESLEELSVERAKESSAENLSSTNFDLIQSADVVSKKESNTINSVSLSTFANLNDLFTTY